MSRVIVLGGAALAATALVPLGASASTVKPGTESQVKSLVATSVKIDRLTSTVAAELPKAAGDNASVLYGMPWNCATASACVYGDRTGLKSIVLFGDSHARMWLGSIIPIATTDKLKLVLLGQNGCPVVQITGLYFNGCNAILRAAIATINTMRPAAVLLADQTSYPGFSSATWQARMTATIKALGPSRAKLAVIGDIQALTTDPTSCLAAYPSRVQKCAGPNPNTKLPGQQKAEQAAATAAEDPYINPTPWLCTTAKCSVVVGNMIAYWNSTHVSVTYSKYLSTVMAAALKTTLQP